MVRPCYGGLEFSSVFSLFQIFESRGFTSMIVLELVQKFPLHMT